MLLLPVLKWIGILLLGILGLAVLLIALLLFAPFRYRIAGSFRDQTPDAEAGIRWLLGLLGLKAAWHPGTDLRLYVSVCGFKVYDILGGRGKKNDREGSSEAGSGEPAKTEEQPVYCAEEAPREAAAEGSSPETAEGAGANADQLSGKIREAGNGLKEKLRAKLAGAMEKLRAKLAGIMEKLRQLYAQLTDRTDRAKALYALYKKEEYQKPVAMVKKRIMGLLKELCPRKGRGRIRYGSGDPFGTAQVMQIAALLYPLIGKRVEVIPDFDREVLEAQADIRGRLRFIIPVEAALRIFFSKKLRKMYKEARRILDAEALPAGESKLEQVAEDRR